MDWLRCWQRCHVEGGFLSLKQENGLVSCLQQDRVKSPSGRKMQKMASAHLALKFCAVFALVLLALSPVLAQSVPAGAASDAAAATPQSASAAAVSTPSASTVPASPTAQASSSAPVSPTAQAAPSAPAAQPGNISGTVLGSDDGVISEATVTLFPPDGKSPIKTISNGYGGFAFNDVPPGGPYRVRIDAPNCIPWNSQPITLAPGQFLTVKNISVRIYGGTISVVVRPQLTEAQIATQQVQQEVKQRVLGFIPNYYVTYEKHPAPLSTKLKYKLAMHAAFDPVTIVGSFVIAGIEQAGDYPNYQQGFAGYMQRFGANYGNGTIDIMLGGAVLPSLLHQDPRYFYQETGSKRSRLLHAISAPFICYGDNGKREINYSSIGGDILTGAISNLYYPSSNRGPGIVFGNALFSTAGRIMNAIAQEFILRKFTSHSSGSSN